LVVKSLPEAGKPKSFQGAVGNFQFKTFLNKREVRQNGTLRLTMMIEGEGNIGTLSRPELPELAGVKVYESDSSVQVIPHGGRIGGRKTFEVTLIPRRSGTLQIPPIEFSFFNPQVSSYFIQKSTPFTVEVLPGKGGSLDEFEEVSEDESTALPIRKKALRIGQAKAEKPLQLGLGILTALLALVATGLRHREKKEAFYAKHSGLKRRIEAASKAERELGRLKRLLKKRDGQKWEEFLSLSQSVMSEFLADKFNISSQSITLTEIRFQLEHFGVEAEAHEKIKSFYEHLDRTRFAGQSITESEGNTMIHLLEETVRYLENKIK